MNLFREQFRVMLGGDPVKPAKEDQSPQVQVVHLRKRGEKFAPVPHGDANKWRNRRWFTLILINMLFVVSYQFDVQLVEGALTASRVLGFHFADLNSAIQVMLAFKELLINLLIGTVTVILLWGIFGGRAFCSWTCPYHLLAELTEKLHLKLRAKGWALDVDFHRGTRTVLYALFAVAAFVSGYTVYEAISPTGIVSRALIYGPGVAMVWVLFLLLFETLVSRRAWCRYVCPIGLTYGFVGTISPFKVIYRVEDCQHEGECRKVCLVPHVLECVKKGRATQLQQSLGPDCTRCGLCIDVCPTQSLVYQFKAGK